MPQPPTDDVRSPDRPTLARDSGRTVVGALVSNACNVLVILVIARWLGGEAVGLYTIAFAMRAILLLVCGLGMRTAMTRFVSAHLARGEPDEVRGAVRAGILVSLGLATVTAVVWWAAAGVIARDVFGDATLELPLQLFALSLPFYGLVGNALAATQGFQTMRAYVWVGQVLEPATRVALTVLVLALGGGIDSVSAALLGASVVGAVAALWALRRMLAALPGSGKRTSWRELASFSSSSWVASMATQGLLWADVLILGVLVSAAEVGAYQVAARVVLIGMIVITPLTASMAPRVAYLWARDDRPGAVERYSRVVLWSTRLTLPVLAGVAAVPGVILGVFGPTFAGATTVVLILVSGAVAEAVGAPSAVLLNQIGRNRLNMVINLFALALNIGLNLTLIPVWGIEGAAVAWAVTLVAGAAVRIVAVRRVAAAGWPWTRPVVVALAGGVLACAAAAGAAALVPDLAPLQLVVAGVVVVTLYTGVVALLGLERDERVLLSREVAVRLPGLRRWRVQRQLRRAATGAETVSIDEVISPFRVDVLARAELYTLARTHADVRRDDPARFLALVRDSLYGRWFDEVLVARGHVSDGSPASRERAFRSIVTAALQLLDRHDRHGSGALGRVVLTRVPAGTPLGGWTLAEDRWVLLDGSHRMALALLGGRRELAASDYVVVQGQLPPNNTAQLLRAATVGPREVVAFLGRGLARTAGPVGDRSWSGLLGRLDEPANRSHLERWPEAGLLAGRDAVEVPLSPS